MWWLLLALSWPWGELESPSWKVRQEAESCLLRAADCKETAAELALESLDRIAVPAAQTRLVSKRVFAAARRRLVLSGRTDRLPLLSDKQALSLVEQAVKGRPGTMRRLHLLVLRKENAQRVAEACVQVMSRDSFLNLPGETQREVELLEAWCRSGFVVVRYSDKRLSQVLNLVDGRPIVIRQDPWQVSYAGDTASVSQLAWLPKGTYRLGIAHSHNADVPAACTVIYHVSNPLQRSQLLYRLLHTPASCQLKQVGERTWASWKLPKLPEGWWNVVQCLPDEVNSRHLPQLLSFPDQDFYVDVYSGYRASLHHTVCTYLAKHGTLVAVEPLIQYGMRYQQRKHFPYVNPGYAAAFAILQRYPHFGWLRRLEQSEDLLYEDEDLSISVADTARGLRMLREEVPLHRVGLVEVVPQSLASMGCSGFIPDESLKSK